MIINFDILQYIIPFFNLKHSKKFLTVSLEKTSHAQKLSRKKNTIHKEKI